jgi:hypothetical protein
MYLVQGFSIGCQSFFPLRGHITRAEWRGNDKERLLYDWFCMQTCRHANMQTREQDDGHFTQRANSLRFVERELHREGGQTLRKPKEEVRTVTPALANRVADLLNSG